MQKFKKRIVAPDFKKLGGMHPKISGCAQLLLNS